MEVKNNNISVVISATGLYKPKHTISNEELVKSFNSYVKKFNEEHQDEINSGTIEALKESSSDFIEKASGIKSRYVVEKSGILDIDIMHPIIPQRSDEELSLQAEMGVYASKDALKNANLKAEDIDLIILASSINERAYPAVSIEIQNELGSLGYAYDMNVACSSAAFGIQNAYNAIVAKSAKRVLVINVEICTGHMSFRDRDSHFIFGDVATAIILEDEQLVKNKDNCYKILDISSHTVFSNNIRNNFGFLNRCDLAKDKNDLDKLFSQQGRKVFKEVSPKATGFINELLESNSVSVHDIKRFWIHQANINMNNLIIRKLTGEEVDEKKMPIILDEYANTSSAGCIIAFHLYHNDLKSKDLGLLSAFGAGYSIGVILLEKC